MTNENTNSRSWQLDIVQHDINLLLQSQRDWQNKLDGLNERCVSFEYRLRTIEKKEKL